MTLNITVMTRDVVYQSADFRLVDLSTGDPCDYDSRKSFTFNTRIGKASSPTRASVHGTAKTRLSG